MNNSSRVGGFAVEKVSLTGLIHATFVAEGHGHNYDSRDSSSDIHRGDLVGVQTLRSDVVGGYVNRACDCDFASGDSGS